MVAAAQPQLLLQLLPRHCPLQDQAQQQGLRQQPLLQQEEEQIQVQVPATDPPPRVPLTPPLFPPLLLVLQALLGAWQWQATALHRAEGLWLPLLLQALALLQAFLLGQLQLQLVVLQPPGQALASALAGQVQLLLQLQVQELAVSVALHPLECPVLAQREGGQA